MQMNWKKTHNDSKYTYGTSSAAARRLEEIAKFFNPLATDFVRSFALSSCDNAVDVGCGPGFTTDMLRRAAGCADTYGLDNSEEFLEMSAVRFQRCTFMKHDVTRAPFPIQADIMYVRFLLSHLVNPIALVNTWITQLNTGGLLLIEEVESIQTEVQVFMTYLAINEGMIANQGASLYIGRELSKGKYDADVLLNDRVEIPVANCQAATWFIPNTMTVWNENEYVLERLSASERERIRKELSQLQAQQDKRSNITWRMRRLVLRSRKISP